MDSPTNNSASLSIDKNTLLQEYEQKQGQGQENDGSDVNDLALYEVLPLRTNLEEPDLKLLPPQILEAIKSSVEAAANNLGRVETVNAKLTKLRQMLNAELKPYALIDEYKKFFNTDPSEEPFKTFIHTKLESLIKESQIKLIQFTANFNKRHSSIVQKLLEINPNNSSSNDDDTFSILDYFINLKLEEYKRIQEKRALDKIEKSRIFLEKHPKTRKKEERKKAKANRMTPY